MPGRPTPWRKPIAEAAMNTSSLSILYLLLLVSCLALLLLLLNTLPTALAFVGPH